VLRSTFLHVPGVSARAEKSLWDQGAQSWAEFLGSPSRWDIAGVQHTSVSRVLKNSETRLEGGDWRYFRKRIPAKEHWRVYPEFADSILFLDIETDGGWSGSSITMIGCYDGCEFRAFVKGKDLDEFPAYLERFSTLVTFFGSGFDIPMLRKLYFTLPFDQLHIDLCPAMRRLGYRGGLKKIERQLGIARDGDTDGLTGRDAITLWNHYRRGDPKALDLLVAYNREDVVNLKTLLKFTYEGLRQDSIGSLAGAR
jgi:uncharacterized protein YprB with RNaseH-like and TPR domain